jgi:hypothetical protein
VNQSLEGKKKKDRDEGCKGRHVGGKENGT